ncbi:hypothetical protein [Lake Baikal phage Baikal-20-5m-C28]|nr:hypothetical protein [Lake Baikal phage Baikal-20-5m-C28]
MLFNIYLLRPMYYKELRWYNKDVGWGEMNIGINDRLVLHHLIAAMQ